MVYKRMDDTLFNLKKDSNDIYDSNAGKITVIIVDRSYDPITQLMHDFYY